MKRVRFREGKLLPQGCTARKWLQCQTNHSIAPKPLLASKAAALNSQPLNHDVSKTAIGQYLNNAGNKYFIPLLVDSMLAIITWLPEFLRKNKTP